jgi:hypothetical protein
MHDDPDTTIHSRTYIRAHAISNRVFVYWDTLFFQISLLTTKKKENAHPRGSSQPPRGVSHTLAPLPCSCMAGAEEGARKSYIVSLYISRQEQRSTELLACWCAADTCKNVFMACGMIPGWLSSPDCRTHVQDRTRGRGKETDQSEWSFC